MRNPRVGACPGKTIGLDFVCRFLHGFTNDFQNLAIAGFFIQQTFLAKLGKRVFWYRAGIQKNT